MGHHPIDLMAGMPLFAIVLMHAWIFSFGVPPWLKGHYHLLSLDFHPDILFGSLPTSPSTGLTHGLNSCHEQYVQKFCKQAIAQCQQHQLAENIDTLLQKDILHLDNID